jgi:tetratricopeptide (TPR) repeat protein
LQIPNDFRFLKLLIGCATGVAALQSCAGSSAFDDNYSRRLWENELFHGNAEYRDGNYAKAQERFLSTALEAEHFGPFNRRQSISLDFLANCLRHQNKTKEVATILEKERQIWSVLSKDGKDETIRSLAAEEEAETLTRLASNYLLLGEFDKAKQCANKAISLFDLFWNAAGDKITGQQFAKALSIYAYLVQKNGDVEQAAGLYKCALRVNAEASGTEQSSEALWRSYLQVTNGAGEINPYSRRCRTIAWLQLIRDGTTAKNDRAYPYAERLLLQALREADKPGVSQIRLAESLSQLVDLYLRMENYAKAGQCCRRLVVVLESALGPRDPYLINPLLNLSKAYGGLKRWQAANDTFRRAVTILKTTDLDELSGNIFAQVYIFMLRKHEYKIASDLLHRKFESLNKNGAAGEFEIACAACEMSDWARAFNRSEGEWILKKTIPILESYPESCNLGVEMQRLALMYTMDFVAYKDKDKAQAAERLFRRALPIVQRNCGQAHPGELILTLGFTANLLRSEGRYKEAAEYYQRVFELGSKNHTLEQSAIMFAADYAKMLNQLGRAAEARELMTKLGPAPAQEAK